MTITEISQRFGITTDTIRYYVRIKLVPPIKRDSNGIRNFTEEDCNWVYFIKQLRSAGISIETLVEYVSLFQEGISTVGARKELLIEQLRIVENRMKEIQETYERLKLKVDGYEERILVREEKLKKFNEGEKE